MSRLAQAPGSGIRVGLWSIGPKAAVLLFSALSLSACMSSGLGLKPGVDTSLVTGSIQDDADKPRDVQRMSDEATIRNAVSAADIDSQGARPLAWANADTGARGSITSLSEFREDGLVCRRFSTTKESFDGVRLFKGQACMVSAGAWRLEKLDAL